MQKTVNLTGRKIAAIALSAVLLVGGSVAGTMAYLQSQTDVVTNAFTVGQVVITLDETNVDQKNADGSENTDARDIANTYKLIPGQTYVKDPIVHFAANNEASYLFVKVDNQIEGIIEENTAEGGSYSIEQQILGNGWQVLSEGSDGVVYWKAVPASTDAVDYPVFASFTVDAAAEYDDLEALKDKKINVIAYAVQAAGFATAAQAWSMTFGA